MKMITAIINKKDSNEVCTALTKGGYFFTKMATTGGFLSSGNTTILIGTEDEKVQGAMDIIRKHCSRRTEIVPATVQSTTLVNIYPAKVIVGGATVFVTNVETFEKM